MKENNWARLLAYVTGLINQELHFHSSLLLLLKLRAAYIAGSWLMNATAIHSWKPVDIQTPDIVYREFEFS